MIIVDNWDNILGHFGHIFGLFGTKNGLFGSKIGLFGSKMDFLDNFWAFWTKNPTFSGKTGKWAFY
jgi:hypothetical protein